MNTQLIGRGWSLPTKSRLLQPDAQGKLITLTNYDNEIEQAIGIILMTAPGERVMRPTFGCQIHELVFAPNNRETAVHAERYVKEALGMWEPRIEITSVRAYAANSNHAQDWLGGQRKNILNREATLMIAITYEIKSTKDSRSLVYPFYLIPEEN